MGAIKTYGNASEGPMKIQRLACDALVITRATLHHLGNLSMIQRP